MSSLETHQLAALRIPLEDILIATNGFSEKNLLKRIETKDVYKGVLPLKTKVQIHDVVIWRYSRHAFDFYKQIETLSRIKRRRNVVSLVGFCDDNVERMIVMEHVVNGSFNEYLSDLTTLTISQKLHICLGAALALEDMDRDHIMKGGFKILLDKDWEAKVLICMDSVESENYFDDVVYALGVILLGVLYGRKTTVEDVNEYRTIEHLKDLDDMIDPNIRKHMVQGSMDIITLAAYDCLREPPEGRLSIDRIVGKLKKAFAMQSFEDDILLQKDRRKDRLKNLEDCLAHLKVPLSDIKLATYDFANAYCIMSQGNTMMYRGELQHFYRECVLTIDEDNKGEPLKKTIIVQRVINIQNYEKRRECFITEIEMLAGRKHPNLLSLLGFCNEDSEMILVFECAFKQTLVDCLGSTSTANLTWERRIRICLDIAHGLKYLHDMESEPSMIHEGMLSAYVVLDEKWTAKIAYFNDTWLFGSINAPSIGVTLFEILTGRLACDLIYKAENVYQFVSMAQRHFKEGKLRDIVDPRILEETRECSYTLKIGPDQDSFYTFSEIAYQCLIEAPSQRPTLEVVIKSLEKALYFQLHNLEHLKIPLEEIQSATENFDQKYLLGAGGYGEVYKAELSHFDIRSFFETKMQNITELPKVRNTVAIKRIFNRKDGEAGFLAELDALSKCQHPHIVSLLGFCVEGNDMFLVYEHAFHGSLDNYLENNMLNLTWAQRLKMSIDIAQGLVHLHTDTEDKRRIIHRDIKSANILLGKNWEAKIADFGLSKIHHVNQQVSTINTEHIAGTKVYMDPEYVRTGKLKKASDVYSFGVVLFEIFSGKLAYDLTYMYANENGLPAIAHKHFENGTLKEILDPKLMDEAHELSCTLKVGPCHDSLSAFSKVAYQCLAKTQTMRPTIGDVVEELEKALKLQENRKDTLKMPLEDITLGVKNFSDENCIGRGGCGKLYRGEVQYDSGHKKVIVKRFSRPGQEHGFLREFEVLFKHKQENIIGLVGYCKEMNEKIIVYENASNGCLCKFLKDASFSWATRLKICIDIAKGLNFIHGGDVGQDVVIHRDLKSSNIMLTEDWKANICGFEHALIYPPNQEIEYVINDVVGSPGYCDPMYWETHTLTKESDIYSFGVILFEILCGRLACPVDFVDSSQFLDVLAKGHFQVARVDEIVFEGIKDQIVLESLATFRRIAFQCLHEEREERPTASEVVVQLQKALEFQEAYEIWEAKLPMNYNEILQFSKSPEIYSAVGKKDMHDILLKGILLKDDNLWFSIGDNGERNEMISARMFSYKDRWSHKWRSIQESRFRKVAEMLDISNLNIQIKTRPLLLPSDVKYNVRLVFKFCGPIKSHAKRMYVNLKYQMGNKNLHAYFATWRDEEWMKIELCRFSNYKKDANFEVLLEGFSRCYCDSRAIYIEGIEFQAIENVKHEKMEKLNIQQVVRLPSEMKIKKDRILWHRLSKKKRKAYHTESAQGLVYDISNVIPITSLSLIRSRVEWIYKVPRRSVFCIKWYMKKYKMMSPNTECVCYLVFKLSKDCRGLHCPVIVRDMFHWKSKEIIYFRSPSPWNLHDSDCVPKKRRDGWMEVVVSKFNSDFVLKRCCSFRKMKLITYEGTMSGLIIRGIEFRQKEA